MNDLNESKRPQLDRQMDSTINKKWKFEVFFDGECPLCKREIDLIKRKDKLGQIRFTDISQPDFSASDTGKTLHELMRFIHGRNWLNGNPGDLVTGVEVFRKLYDLIGFRRSVGFSRLPLIRNFLNIFYQAFAFLRFRHAKHRFENRNSRIRTNENCETCFVAKTDTLPDTK